MTTLEDVKIKVDYVRESLKDYSKDKNENIQSAVEELYTTIRNIKTGAMVGPISDKLFRQAKLLKMSAEALDQDNNTQKVEKFITNVLNVSQELFDGPIDNQGQYLG